MKIFPLIAFGFLSVFPWTAEAAPFLNPIVPEACQACPCGFGGVLQIIQNLMNFGIGIAIIFATIIIAWGGFLYIMSSANPESRSKANKMLINAAIGLLVVLSAWLIVDFVMKSLYDGETSKFGPWNTIIGTSGDICIEKNDNVRGLYDRGVSVAPTGDGSGVVSEGEYTTEQAKAALTAGSVGFNSGISMQGTRVDTINQAIALRAACNCTIIVTSTTGGTHETGPGHTHGNGYKIDLGLNQRLNAFIQSMRYGGVRPGSNGGPTYYDRCGNEYVKESDHWDITVNKGVCSY